MNLGSIVTVSALIGLLNMLGCSTPYELKKSNPIISYATTKPAIEVKKCILKKWSEHHSPVYDEKTDHGWLIRFNDTFPGATVAIATAEEDGADTKVNYYNRSKSIRLHRFEDNINDCK